MDGRTDARRLAAGAMLLALTLVIACDDELAPPLAVVGSGSLEGFVFFDASEDGVFDAADGDFGIAALSVAVQERGTGQTFSGGSTSTGADGRFSLAGLPAGTHDLLIDTLTVPEGINICENPVDVTINIGETRFADVRGRPGCLITIAAAKELAAGAFAIVKGVVTAAPGQIESSWTYIQDASAGAKIFSGALNGQGLEVGDQIEIGGTVGANAGDFEFTSPVLRGVVPDVGAPSPMLVTTAAIAASGSDFTDPVQGALIRVAKAEFTGIFTSIGNLQNGPIDDGSGGTVIRIEDGVADRNSLNDLMTVGVCYDIVGVGGTFLGTGEIFPRTLADIEEVACN